MTLDRLGGDLRQVLCRDGSDGGECAEGGEAICAAPRVGVPLSALARILVALISVAEADIDFVVSISIVILKGHNL